MIFLYVILFVVILKLYIITEQFCNIEHLCNFKELKENNIDEPPIVSPYINYKDYNISKDFNNYKNKLKQYFNLIKNC